MKDCYLWGELAVYQLSESECLGVLCRTDPKGWPWGYVRAACARERGGREGAPHSL